MLAHMIFQPTLAKSLLPLQCRASGSEQHRSGICSQYLQALLVVAMLCITSHQGLPCLGHKELLAHVADAEHARCHLAEYDLVLEITQRKSHLPLLREKGSVYESWDCLGSGWFHPNPESSLYPCDGRVLLQMRTRKLFIACSFQGHNPIWVALTRVQKENTPGFYSNMFLVHKASRGWRAVIDLKQLNTHL